jgi:hypothetical protein
MYKFNIINLIYFKCNIIKILIYEKIETKMIIIKILKDHFDEGIQIGSTMRRCVGVGSYLLVKRSVVLRYLAESQFPVSSCTVAFVHLHHELYSNSAICVFLCTAREAATISGTEILA